MFVTVLLSSDVAYAIIHCLVNGNKEPKIHIAAHAGGACCGILLGFIFYESRRDENRETVERFRTFKRASLAIYLSFVLFVLILNVVQHITKN